MNQDNGIATCTSQLLRSLRLLDLNVSSEWNEYRIDEETFKEAGTQPGQRIRRVRCAEWILYRLFELWDPAWTQSAIRSYFPVQRPQQSIALRTELFRALDSLRLHGQLGGEVVLRKSTLDECGGPRFVQLLLAFSILVLQKVVSEQGLDPVQPTLIAVESLGNTTWAQGDILSLAYESTTRRLLQQRQDCEASLRAAERLLTNNEWRLAQRDAAWRDYTQALSDAVSIKGHDLARIKGQMQDELTNLDGTRDHYLNLLLDGSDAACHDRALESIPERFWAEGINEDSEVYHKSTTLTMLEHLERLQDERVDSFRSFQRQVSMRNERFIVQQSPAKTPRSLTQHRTGYSPRKSPNKRANVHTTPRSPLLNRKPSTPSKHKPEEKPQRSLSPTRQATNVLARSTLYDNKHSQKVYGNSEDASRKDAKQDANITDTNRYSKTSDITAANGSETEQSATTGRSYPSLNNRPLIRSLSQRARDSMAAAHSANGRTSKTSAKPDITTSSSGLMEEAGQNETSNHVTVISLSDRVRGTLASSSILRGVSDAEVEMKRPEPTRTKSIQHSNPTTSPGSGLRVDLATKNLKNGHVVGSSQLKNEDITSLGNEGELGNTEEDNPRSKVRSNVDAVEKSSTDQSVTVQDQKLDFDKGVNFDEANIFQTRSRLRRSPPPPP